MRKISDERVGIQTSERVSMLEWSFLSGVAKRIWL